MRTVKLTKERWQVNVISLTDMGYYGDHIRDLGDVTLNCCGMPRGRVTLRGLSRLFRFIRQANPAIVQTWLYHADLIGGIASRLLGYKSVIWGIRNSNLGTGSLNWRTRGIAKLCALLSAFVPQKIIANSNYAIKIHVNLGYKRDKFVLIPNGYDGAIFKPDRPIGYRFRKQWQIKNSTLLIGMVARWDPLKDHHNFLRAFKFLLKEVPEASAVLVGQGMNEANIDLKMAIADLGLTGNVVLAGPVDDTPGVMNAIDLHVLSSIGESFPNVVAEAMACGVPCVATDVGDVSLIIGSNGWIVPPGDSNALAKAMILATHEIKSGKTAVMSDVYHSHIVSNFGLNKMVAQFEGCWNYQLREN
jgi:glycosyltransferase involved in cell wall biosynthesis